MHKSLRLVALLILAGCARPPSPSVDVRAEAIDQRKDALVRAIFTDAQTRLRKPTNLERFPAKLNRGFPIVRE